MPQPCDGTGQEQSHTSLHKFCSGSLPFLQQKKCIISRCAIPQHPHQMTCHVNKNNVYCQHYNRTAKLVTYSSQASCHGFLTYPVLKGTSVIPITNINKHHYIAIQNISHQLYQNRNSKKKKKTMSTPSDSDTNTQTDHTRTLPYQVKAGRQGTTIYKMQEKTASLEIQNGAGATLPRAPPQPNICLQVNIRRRCDILGPSSKVSHRSRFQRIQLRI